MPILWEWGVAWPYRKRWPAKAGLDVVVWFPCWINGCSSAFRSTMFILFKKFFEDTGPFCGTTDTPVLDFWQHLPLVSKPGWILLLVCLVSCMKHIPQIHLWCDTCWPFGLHNAYSSLKWLTLLQSIFLCEFTQDSLVLFLIQMSTCIFLVSDSFFQDVLS